jgi:lipopolysaccharide/colanic/teichoic acid biosynthesis glycosyltransferase
MEHVLAPRSVVRSGYTAETQYGRPVTRRRRQGEVALQLVPATTVADVIDREVLEDQAYVPRARSEMITRALNLTVASVAVVATAPLMLLVAGMIKLTSKGPVMYSQTRVGVDRRWGRKGTDGRRLVDHGGRPFRMFKFRSMRVDAESDGRAVWAQKHDPRVTPIGGFLRKTRLDELPQLFNVIRGDMNIVGPRPERPSIFAELRESIPEYPVRQRVKPGITGWAQINQAYDTCVDDVRNKVRYDLEYLRRQSLGLDLRIMSMTIPVMLLRRGGQ